MWEILVHEKSKELLVNLNTNQNAAVHRNSGEDSCAGGGIYTLWPGANGPSVLGSFRFKTD
jgi:hypothetical protein